MQPSPSRRGLLGLAACSLTTGCSAVSLTGESGSFPDIDWPMTGRDARNTAFVPGATVPADVEGQWSVNVPYGSVTSPVVAEGTVYIGTSDELRAYRASDGEPRWTAGLPHETFGTPAVDTERATVYATSTAPSDEPRADVLAFDTESGERRWRTQVGAEAVYAVRLHEGDLFVRTDDGCVALDPEGEIRWRRDGLGPVAAETYRVDDARAGDVAPTVADGRVYVTADDALLALDRETGELAWEVSVEHAYGCPAVGDGVVYVQGYVSMKAVTTAGEVLWTREEGALWQPPLAGDSVFLDDETGTIAEVDTETGETRWTYDVGTDVVAATPIVLGDAVIVTGVRSGAVARERPWFGLGERERWRLDEQADPVLSPAVGAGRLIVLLPFARQLAAFA